MSEDKKHTHSHNTDGIKLLENQEFIPAEEYIADKEETENVIQISDWESTLAALADKNTTSIRIPRQGEVNRKAVVSAFMNAFELIGGTPRLALWGHDNPKEFYKLYAKLLPSQASSAMGESNELVVRHVLPRGNLD